MLQSFATWPRPWSPTCTTSLPTASKTGRARSAAACDPPTMIVSVPASAPIVPPDLSSSATKHDKVQDLDAVSVIGTGETRQVQRLRPSDQKALPPGTSLQKVLNTLPGVNAQSVDALGTNEQSMTLSLRGFSGTAADVIANNNSVGTVTISAADKGFKSARCGTWTKQ